MKKKKIKKIYITIKILNDVIKNEIQKRRDFKNRFKNNKQLSKLSFQACTSTISYAKACKKYVVATTIRNKHKKVLSKNKEKEAHSKLWSFLYP